ncbi:MAG: SH3 domain-containing protein [Rhodocyclaceae bacterium]
MMNTRLFMLVAALALGSTSAQAIEFRSVSEPAILYDTPSEQGRKMFIIAAGTPVEVVVVTDQWVKVRDPGGAITWIEERQLSAQRTVMVTTDRATVRQRPEPDAPAVFETVRDAVLDLRGAPVAGWVQVAHRDGNTGFIRVTDIWGL